MSYDIIILGGGPGGYPAAIRLARAGLKVALVEADRVGGECTNYGCVPTKALVEYAHTLSSMRQFGIEPARDPVEYLNHALGYSRSIAGEVSKSIEDLLSSSGVSVYHGEGVVSGRNTVSVNGERLEWRRALVISTGSDPYNPFNTPVDGRRVHDNRSILEWDSSNASRVAIIGGGYIGVEYSFILSSFGLVVTLIEALNRLLPVMDRDFGLLARRLLAKRGVKVSLNSPVESISPVDGGVKISTGRGEIIADAALVAIGRRPRNREALRLGVEVDGKGYVRVDDCGRTNVNGVYATGDLAGPPLLAHKAIHESLRTADCILGEGPSPLKAVPSVVYGPLDLVSVGYTLDEASSRGVKAVEVRIPTGALARSRIHGVPEGFVKVVYEKGSRRIIGVHMAFPSASEVAASAAALVSLGVTLERALEVVFPHPTMSEALQEAVNAAVGRMVHVKSARVREN